MSGAGAVQHPPRVPSPAPLRDHLWRRQPNGSCETCKSSTEVNGFTNANGCSPLQSVGLYVAAGHPHSEQRPRKDHQDHQVAAQAFAGQQSGDEEQEEVEEGARDKVGRGQQGNPLGRGSGAVFKGFSKGTARPWRSVCKQQVQVAHPADVLHAAADHTAELGRA